MKLGRLSGEYLDLSSWWSNLSAKFYVHRIMNFVADMVIHVKRAMRPNILGFPYILFSLSWIIIICLTLKKRRFKYYGIKRGDCEGTSLYYLLGETIIFSLVPRSCESSCQASLIRITIKDLFLCNSFVRVKFWSTVSYKCSSSMFFQFTETVPLLVCFTVDKVSSNTTWYWGGIYPVLMLNNKSVNPSWNGKWPRDTWALSVGSYLGIPTRSPCMELSRTNIGQPCLL